MLWANSKSEHQLELAINIHNHPCCVALHKSILPSRRSIIPTTTTSTNNIENIRSSHMLITYCQPFHNQIANRPPTSHGRWLCSNLHQPLPPKNCKGCRRNALAVFLNPFPRGIRRSTTGMWSLTQLISQTLHTSKAQIYKLLTVASPFIIINCSLISGKCFLISGMVSSATRSLWMKSSTQQRNYRIWSEKLQERSFGWYIIVIFLTFCNLSRMAFVSAGEKGFFWGARAVLAKCICSLRMCKSKTISCIKSNAINLAQYTLTLPSILHSLIPDWPGISSQVVGGIGIIILTTQLSAVFGVIHCASLRSASQLCITISRSWYACFKVCADTVTNKKRVIANEYAADSCTMVNSWMVEVVYLPWWMLVTYGAVKMELEVLLESGWQHIGLLIPFRGKKLPSKSIYRSWCCLHPSKTNIAQWVRRLKSEDACVGCLIIIWQIAATVRIPLEVVQKRKTMWRK